jgi:glycosyltransferase involved in cell wall biosynthesis
MYLKHMRENPKISVVTPVYNGETYIEETIRSVLDAIGNRNIEYIVVNDGSTDLTSQILSQFEEQVVILSQSNLGESTAVNSGIHKSTGNFILIVSADDPLFTSEIFDGVEEKFESNPGLVAWYCDWRMLNEIGEVIKIVHVEEFSQKRLVEDFICLPGPGTFFRKTSALQIKGRRAKWKYVADYDFWLRLTQVGMFEKRPKVLAQWRNHSKSTSISSRGKEMAKERIEVISEFISDFEIDAKAKRNALGQAYFSAACLSFFSPKVPGKIYLMRAILLRPTILRVENVVRISYIVLSPISRLVYWLYKFRIKLVMKTDD